MKKMKNKNGFVFQNKDRATMNNSPNYNHQSPVVRIETQNNDDSKERMVEAHNDARFDNQ